MIGQDRRLFFFFGYLPKFSGDETKVKTVVLRAQGNSSLYGGREILKAWIGKISLSVLYIPKEKVIWKVSLCKRECIHLWRLIFRGLIFLQSANLNVPEKTLKQYNRCMSILCMPTYAEIRVHLAQGAKCIGWKILCQPSFLMQCTTVILCGRVLNT